MSNPIWKREENLNRFLPLFFIKLICKKNRNLMFHPGKISRNFKFQYQKKLKNKLTTRWGLVKLQLRLQQDLYEKLVRLAEYHGKNLQSFIRDILQTETTK